MPDLKALRTLEATAILLFLLQAVRVLFSVMFGFAYNAVFAETMPLGSLGAIILFVLVAFLAPLAALRHDPRVALMACTVVASLARIPLSINQPTIRLSSSLLIVAPAGIYAATLLRQRPRAFATALLLAFAADQFLRAAGNAYHISLRTWWLPLQVVLSSLACVTARLVFSRDGSGERLPVDHKPFGANGHRSRSPGDWPDARSGAPARSLCHMARAGAGGTSASAR